MVVVMVVWLQRGEIVVRLPQPGVAVGQERGCAVVLSEVYFLFFVIKVCSGKPDTAHHHEASCCLLVHQTLECKTLSHPVADLCAKMPKGFRKRNLKNF